MEIGDGRDSLRFGLFERTTYGAIGRYRKVGFVARRLTLKWTRLHFQTRNGDQMIALFGFVSFVAMTWLRVHWLSKRHALARQQVRK
jgi:hypothetical protein